MSDLLYLMSFKNVPPVGPFYYDDSNLHLTVLDSFSIPNKNLYGFIENMESLSRWFQPLSLNTSEADWFGLYKDIPVMKFEYNEELMSLHQSMCDLVFKFQGSMRTPGFSGNSYDPHVSYFDGGENFWYLNNFSLIEHRGGFGVDVYNHQNFFLE